MSEGFSDVIGHAVEHLRHNDPETPGQHCPECKDWDQGEDWDPDGDLRSADHYDSDHQCPGWHYSVHVDDDGCDPNDTGLWHVTGNRLAVIFRLMAEGGCNPADGLIEPCTGCDTCVDPDDALGVGDAFKILFRVLTVQADSSTTDWDDLPMLALASTYDLFHEAYPPCAVHMQRAVRDAFEATGYPESGFLESYYSCPVVHCPPSCPQDE